MALAAWILNLDGDPDVIAPVLDGPIVVDVARSTASVSVNTDEANGTMYWYFSASATPPSATDLKAGTGAASAGSEAVVASGLNTLTAIGSLSPSTSYYAHLLHRDAAGNDSDIVSSDQFQTDAALAPTQFSITPAGDTALLIVDDVWSAGAGGLGGFTVTGFSGGSVTLGSPIGEDTDTFAFPITNRIIGSHETGGVFNYTQPGNGIESTDGVDMPSFSGFAVVVPNESTQDTLSPTLLSASVNGTSLSLTFSEAVTFGAGGNAGWTITPSGGAATLSYASGDGSSTLVYTISRSIGPEETGTIAYTQPGNGVEDAAGNDLATIASVSFTNLQAQGDIQGLQQLIVRASSGTTNDYNGDFITLMKSDLSVSSGSFDELLVQWLQLKLSSSSTRLDDLRAEAAANRGVSRWCEIVNITAIGS